jgi:integrase
MARGPNQLTSNQVRNAKPGPDGKAVLLCDGANLWLHVGRAKDGRVTKSWIFRYAMPGTGRERHMGLGPLHTVSLAAAREMAADARLLIRQGKDPLEDKASQRATVAAQATRKSWTFDRAATEYQKANEANWKNAIHRGQWAQSLRDYVSPALGKLPVESIGTEHVLKVLEPLWAKFPETASRVRGRIESVLDYARFVHKFAWVDGGNPARWTGHLEHQPKFARKRAKHFAALPWSEAAAFMAELRAADDVLARALEFCILTATRTNEVVGATWSEMNLEARTWTIPVERLKRPGEEADGSHTIPLSDRCVELLRYMDSIRSGERVFPIGPGRMLALLKQLRADLTVHGFRATFKSWAGACTNHARDVTEMALGHAVGNAVERAYQRDALLAKRRVLMNDWCEFCAKSSADVVPMRRQEAIPA